jgi:Uma2 family endonuclease
VAAPQQEEAPGLLHHSEPWTERDWLALPESPNVELVDGALVMSPSGRPRHGVLIFRLCAVLDAVAPPDQRVLMEPNLRLAPDRVLIPDVALVAGTTDLDAVVNDASLAVLVIEVVSPGDAAYDRMLKPRLYAEAGIRWYLRVEQEGPVGHLHELVDGAYREVARGAVVEIAEPFPATLDLPHLTR